MKFRYYTLIIRCLNNRVCFVPVNTMKRFIPLFRILKACYLVSTKEQDKTD